jgi:hypothetical protein
MVETVFYDSPQMVAIIHCESNFVHYKSDGSVLRGRVDAHDSGLAQINTRYHPGVNVDDIWDNLAYARKLYNSEGVTPWVCRNQVALNN